MSKLDKLVVMAMICVLSMGFLVSITSVVTAADLDSGWVTDTWSSWAGLPIAKVKVRVVGHTIQSGGICGFDPFYLLQGYSGVTVFDSGGFEYSSSVLVPGYTCKWTNGIFSVIYYQGGNWRGLYDHTDHGAVSDKLITRDLYPPGAIMLKGECIAYFTDLFGLSGQKLDAVAYLSTPTHP